MEGAVGMDMMSPEYLKGLLALSPRGWETPDVFVETGTHQGKTTAVAVGLFDLVFSIELSQDWYAAACRRFHGVPGLRLIHGDSAKEMPFLARLTDEPAVFYLDAHWFWRPEGQQQVPDTAPFPLWDELSAITPRPYPDLVIVDDLRVFGRSEYAWPIDPQWADVTSESILNALGRDRAIAHTTYGDCFAVWRTDERD